MRRLEWMPFNLFFVSEESVSNEFFERKLHKIGITQQCKQQN